MKVVRLTERRCTLGLQPVQRLSRLSEGCQSRLPVQRWLVVGERLPLASGSSLSFSLRALNPIGSMRLLADICVRRMKFSRELL